MESKKLTDVVDISNQSNKDGIRIVLELRKDADIDRIKNILYKKTKLEDTFGVNMLAIADGRPETLSLKGILRSFMEFQVSEYGAQIQCTPGKGTGKEGDSGRPDCRLRLHRSDHRHFKGVKEFKGCEGLPDCRRCIKHPFPYAGF